MLAKHPDPTVDHVLRIWAPRMIVQGIDFNDLMTTANRIRTWDDWPREWCRTAAGHEQYAREAEAQGRRESATDAHLLAAMAYHFACNNAPHRLEEYIAAARERVACYAAAAPYLRPPAARYEVPFEHFRMASYFRVPAAREKPPVVIVISGLACLAAGAAWLFRWMDDPSYSPGIMRWCQAWGFQTDMARAFVPALVLGLLWWILGVINIIVE